MPAAVGVAFDDQLVAGADEAVDGGLGQERVGHQGQWAASEIPDKRLVVKSCRSLPRAPAKSLADAE